MIKYEELKAKIKETGFSCRMCGQCCSLISDNSNLVLVSAPEIRRIMDGTGLTWGEIAEPYPETLIGDKGEEYTFAWCLNRTEKKCRFLNEDSRCSIYGYRPQICRTYPFMLDESGLLTFECPGTGDKVSEEAAGRIAEELIERARFEREELEKIEKIFSSAELKSDKMNIIDSEGVKTIG
ncbi:YkgJ family cysteine cluster protein [Methanolacinia petrolearia]|uniref:YkgJ family cysteine cluster protein n=1 Tax=Methanolacinia petrolearia TaxID=54120 RepID=UPI003BAAA20E